MTVAKTTTLKRGRIQRKGWNQDAEAKKVDQRTRDAQKRRKDTRVAEVMALRQNASQRAAQSLVTAQATGADLVAQGTTASLLALMQQQNGADEGNKKLKAGKWANYLGSATNVKQLARRVERLGYDVGELEGFQGAGQVTGGHRPNSLHYSGKAMDITGDKLKKLWRALKNSGLPIDEAFFKNKFLGANEGPVSGHDRHIHLGLLQKRGF